MISLIIIKIFLKIFEEEMLIKIQHTTLLQILYEIMIDFKVSFKSIYGTDNSCQGDLQALKG